MLEAAGFDCATATTASPEGDSQDPISEAAPQGQERLALLEAAGFQAADGSAPALDEPPITMNLAAPDLPSNIQLAPLPAYLKPLDWLSAPLDACPAKVRRILGPVAIITMINALAILTYVLVIRKH